MVFSQVWYASETRMRSRSKFAVMDDQGKLTLAGGYLYFQGRKTNFALGPWFELSLTTATLNPIAWLFPPTALLARANKWIRVQAWDLQHNLHVAHFSDGSGLGWGGAFGGTTAMFGKLHAAMTAGG